MIRPILTLAFVTTTLAAAVFACSGSTTETPESSFQGGPDAGVYDSGDPTDPILPVGDGSTNQAPQPGDPEYKCYTASTQVACRNCCHALHPEGRKVFTDAIDACLCQPSKCATACSKDYCSTAHKAPPTGSDCAKCIAANVGLQGDAGAPAAADGGGAKDAGGDAGLYPERGIVYCNSYASALCRDDAECVAAEKCKVISTCSTKQ